jgi:hypothetical protein
MLADALDDLFLYSDIDLCNFPLPFTDDIAGPPRAHSARSCVRKPHHRRNTAASPIPPFAPAGVASGYFDWKIIGHCNRIPSTGMFQTFRMLFLERGDHCLVVLVGRWVGNFGWNGWKSGISAMLKALELGIWEYSPGRL